MKKIYHPIQNTPPHQHKWREIGNTARLGFRKKTGNGKRGWFGPRLPGQVPRGLRCRHPPPGAVRIPPPRHGASLLPAHINQGSGWVRGGGTGGKEYGLGD